MNQNENEMNFQEKVKKKHQNTITIVTVSGFFNTCNLVILIYAYIEISMKDNSFIDLKELILHGILVLFIILIFFSLLFIVYPAFKVFDLTKKMLKVSGNVDELKSQLKFYFWYLKLGIIINFLYLAFLLFAFLGR